MLKRICLLAGLLLVAGCASQTQLLQPPIDRISAQELAMLMPKSVASLSLDEIVRLSKDGLTAQAIIEKIKASNSLYDLSPSQSVALHQQGVDNAVLDYMHSSHEQALMNSMADEINQRESAKRQAIEKLKQEQLNQQERSMTLCNYGGIYPSIYYGPYFGPRYGHGFGAGALWTRRYGCW